MVEEIADLRPLPAVAAHVLQIAEGEHFSAHELAQAISSDLALTARILRLANSAYYGFPRRITTVRDAVVLLGFRQVRSAALAACAMKAMPSSEDIDAEAFWRHSVAVGMLAEMLARSAQQHQDEAFTAGVLHNIGRLALAQAEPAAFAEARRLARRTGVTLHEAERDLFGYTDAEVGGALALHWRFPAGLATAIAGHAQPGCQHPAIPPLARFVARARGLAAEHGLTDGIEEVRGRPASEPAAALAAGSATDDGDGELSMLALAGGFPTLLTRASAFVEHATVVT